VLATGNHLAHPRIAIPAVNRWECRTHAPIDSLVTAGALFLQEPRAPAVMLWYLPEALRFASCLREGQPSRALPEYFNKEMVRGFWGFTRRRFGPMIVLRCSLERR
jgi:hypothetical protein